MGGGEWVGQWRVMGEVGDNCNRTIKKYCVLFINYVLYNL